MSGAHRYSHLHAVVVEHPATLQQQINAINGEIERLSRAAAQNVAAGRWHPHFAGPRLHALRSALLTLQRVQRGELIPSTETTP